MESTPTIAILAGGLATRLGALTRDLPKALLDVADRPFLAWQLELLAASGLTEVVLCVGHHAEQIEAWLAAHPIDGLRVRLCPDGPVARGTGGAIQNALPLLGDPFLVMYGDSYLRCDYREVFRHFLQLTEAAPAAAPLGLMTVFENAGRFDTSNVIFLDGKIVRYDKRAQLPEMRHIDWGLGVFTRAAFEPFAGSAAFDLATVYEQLVADGRLAGLAMRERFYEIGSSAGLEEFRAFARAGASGSEHGT